MEKAQRTVPTPQEKTYPHDLETYRTTKTGLQILLRPVKPEDRERHRAFVLSLSEESVFRKFFRRMRPTDDFLERLMDVDYTTQMALFAWTVQGEGEEIVGMGRYVINPDKSSAEMFLAVRDDCHNQGIGRELVSYLTLLARKQGLKGFTAQVMVDNRPMLHVFRSFEGKDFRIHREMKAGVFYLDMEFL